MKWFSLKVITGVRLGLSGFGLMLIIVTGPLHAADVWTKGDIVREVTWQAFNMIDRQQTLKIAGDPDLDEANPLIDPSNRGRTNTYFVALGLSHWAISHKLPSRGRRWWQVGTLIFTGALIAHNKRMGLSIKF